MFDSALSQVALASGLIFLARILDVSIGTLRIISVSKGRKYFAPVLGFFEILIWLFAIKQVMSNPQHSYFYFAYAAGFACGNYVGLVMEEKLALGWNTVRIIATEEGFARIIDELHQRGHGYTIVDGRGAKEDVKLIFTIVKRKDLRAVERMITRVAPRAFYSVDEIRSARFGIFSPRRTLFGYRGLDYLHMRRKAK